MIKDRKKTKVWFFPVYTQNEYTNIMQECIRKSGYEICISNSIIELLSADIIHLNWFENLSSNKIKRNLVFFYKIILLMIIRFRKTPIIYTFHNKTNHDKKSDKLEEILRNIIWDKSKRIILHSKSSINYLPGYLKNKALYIPHPNYCNKYIPTATYNEYKKQEGKLVVLLFGLIRKYKHTELVIRLAHDYADFDNVDFIICGNCKDENYKKELINSARCRNISLDIRFIDNDEVASLFSLADICLLPYDTSSALNSGVAILAFSFGVTVISTKTATIEDIEHTGLVYSYDYVDDEYEHYKRLKKEFDKMYSDYCDDNKSLEEKGNRLRKMVKDEANLDRVSEKLGELYLLVK